MDNINYFQFGIIGLIVVDAILLSYFISRNKHKLIAASAIVEVILSVMLGFIK